jgi:hypothetical protein
LLKTSSTNVNEPLSMFEVRYDECLDVEWVVSDESVCSEVMSCNVERERHYTNLDVTTLVRDCHFSLANDCSKTLRI